MNYHKRKFRAVINTANCEISSETVFEYIQEGSVLSAQYQGGQVVKGHISGLVDDQGYIEMHYHQVNQKGEVSKGMCYSRPEILSNGKIRLHEAWKWASGDISEGSSILDEI
ncbi:hypothetical protein [Roseivirga seohaensis]|mgnify:CR=1 FL=1|uniref:N-acetylglutamate synthase n=1 Tax=Roseivirga seohaensis TaxID=1914963 RepID=A0A150XWM4_9BACT|nr:hypothetical protein [Roseivirga seohaensis]KYG83179.1 n-acetylglutamate synthase [Roseivirga seohaensis]